jgi:very-short-patch-repair endonuclease
MTIRRNSRFVQSELITAMERRGAVITRAEALQITTRQVVDNAIRRQAIVRVFPATYALARSATSEAVLRRAALAYVRSGALSHTTGLASWRIPHVPLDSRIHVTTEPGNQAKAGSALVVHRRSGFAVGAPDTIVVDGLPVVRLERAIVESWPLLVPSERRGPALVAVREGRTTANRLITQLAPMANVAGRAEMAELFGLLAIGCRSELELWGHNQVFTSHDLPAAHLQYVVTTEAGTFILDRAYLEEMVGVELDGAAWHGSAAQRERDVRRDAALAAAGWLIVRFTHRRLTTDPAGCRADLRRIIETRRSMRPDVGVSRRRSA